MKKDSQIDLKCDFWMVFFILFIDIFWIFAIKFLNFLKDKIIDHSTEIVLGNIVFPLN